MRPPTLGLGLAPALLAVSLLADAAAQDGPATANAGHATLHAARPLDPQPPAGPRQRPPPRGPTLPVPVGTNDLPQPDDPPTGDEAGPLGPGTLRFWKNVSVRPATTSACCPEPSTSIARDTAFMTANTWGAISKDSGHTWGYVNPKTRFPSVDGGACCDQRCIYVESHDITIWYLQYWKSTKTRRGSVRIAVAKGRDGLRKNVWHSWVWNPQHFNQPLDRWLDFPDIAVTGKYLYATSNVFDFANRNKNSIVWRMPLAQLKAGGRLSASYFTRTSPGSPGKLGASGSYRFAQGFGSTMYWASHLTTASIRLYKWTDAGSNRSQFDRNVPAWTGGLKVAKAPNGVNWMGKDDSRIQSGFRTPTEYGFMWVSASQSGRPFPFVRTVRFDSSLNILRATQDTFNGSYAFGYPACAPNLRGDKGVVLASGGPKRHVRSDAFIVDKFKPSFAGQTTGSMNSPVKSPSSARWGDYFTAGRHSVSKNTFVGSGAYVASDGKASARYLWFSRELDQPKWVDLDVKSSPISGVPITVAERDRFGRSNGSTSFTRSYARSQGYELTAPATRLALGRLYSFNRWSGSGGTTTSRTIEVSNIGFVKDTMTAFYDRTNALFVRSTNPSIGVAITVSKTDVLGKKNGSTSFNRFYKSGTIVTLTAPAATALGSFRRWVITGQISTSSRVRTVVMSGTLNRTATAEYYRHFHGTFTAFGTGCPTLRPNHFATGHPDLGTTVTYRVSGAPPNSIGAFYLGTSKTRWGAFNLPLSLSFIGMGSCRLDVSVDASEGFKTNGAGTASLALPLNGSASNIGLHLYTQVAVVNLAVPWPLKITHSRALDTRIGGNRFP